MRAEQSPRGAGETADCWYVVKTHPRAEEQVAVVLSTQGMLSYLPRITSRRKDRQGNHWSEPLFPGYVFVRLCLGSQQWLVARSAPGVSYFLGVHSQGRPVPVPDEVIEAIRARSDANLACGWRPDFQPGDKVMITGGPLAGLEAAFDGLLSPKGRSRVFVEILSRLVPVHVEADLLRRVI